MKKNGQRLRESRKNGLFNVGAPRVVIDGGGRLSRRRCRLDGALGEQSRDLREDAEYPPEEDFLGGDKVLDHGEVGAVSSVLLLGSTSLNKYQLI